MNITLFSFGFKYGHAQASMVWDVRFLPNPYWVTDLRPYTGKDAGVARYVLESASAKAFLALQEPLLAFLLDACTHSNTQTLSLAIGCTGGRHRSVAMVEYLHFFIEQRGYVVNHYHRDVDKQ